MQKQAWIYTIAASVLGALSLLLRWLQCQSIFDAETGLPAAGAGVSVLVTLMLLLTAAALWWLSGRVSPRLDPWEPEAALRLPNRLTGGLMAAAGVLAALGCAVMFFTERSLFMRSTALVGLFSAAALGLYPSLPRWGNFGAALSVVPVVFFSLWLTAFYRDNSTNPVVWEYGVQILAIAGCLLGAFRLSGLLFYRTNPRQGVFGVGLGLCLGLTELMDLGGLGARVLFLGWALGFGVLGWVMVRNFDTQGPPPAENVKTGKEA